MTTIQDVTNAAVAYGDTRTAAIQTMLADVQAQLAADQKAKSDLQAAFDAFKAADATEDAAYEKKIADLQAQIAANAPVAYVEFSDFAQQQSGLFLNATSIAGAGVGKTVYRMKPGTSTQKATVDALATGASNQYRLLRSGGFNSSVVPTGIAHHDFTLQATEQGHPYGGLNIGYGQAPKITDVLIQGIPGYSSGPPGETFATALWRTASAAYTRVVCDGRHPTTGVPVSASLFSTNDVTGTTSFTDCTAKYAQYGFGAALWQSAGTLTFLRTAFANNRKHLNIEQSWGGTYNFTGCKFSAATVPYVAQVSNAVAYPSSKITFTDCTVDGDGILRVLVYNKTASNNQEAADVRCIKNGVDVTGDPTKFLVMRP